MKPDPNPDMNALVGQADIALVVLDTLRHDVAAAEMAAGRTPNLDGLFPEGWEKRHSPGSFTYASHQAFFAGFLPTPSEPGVPHERLFASRFSGSETTGASTREFDAPDIVSGLAGAGYRTLCFGGVGFFNQQTPLSRVLPGYFQESHWSPETGVTGRDSTRLQFRLAARRLAEIPGSERVFLFINVSAIHQPNCHYVAGKSRDDLESHAAALRYVDSQWPILMEAFRRRADTFAIVCSDHGTLYGENGFTGHRVGHETVFTVPYAQAMIERDEPGPVQQGLFGDATGLDQIPNPIGRGDSRE